MSRIVCYYNSLDLRWDNFTEEWVVITEIPVSWVELKNGGVKQLAYFRVAAGFHTDLSSIPSIVPKWILPRSGQYNLPAVVHDWCYENKTSLSRSEADLLFRDGMKETGVSFLARNVMYRAVRMFGSELWN